ncbi:hypothetical protein Pelo_18536 [Pelomyxa schiedti]|nr:hypothetical protein Pelo_18536 [Pelomyxa schiedti]
MAVINSDPDLAGSTLVGICWKYKSIKLGNHLTGLRWYVQHLSRPFKIPDRFIHVAITTAVQTHRAAVLFLVEVFTEFTRDPSPISPWLLENIFVAATKTNMTTLQRLTSTFGDSFTTELAAKCLTSSRFVAHSSKIVKWIIQMSGLHAADFHLDFWSWKMILNKYPQISQDTVQCHLVELATASPHNVQLATDKFGLTLDQNSSPNRAVTQWWRGIDPDS